MCIVAPRPPPLPLPQWLGAPPLAQCCQPACCCLDARQEVSRSHGFRTASAQARPAGGHPCISDTNPGQPCVQTGQHAPETDHPLSEPGGQAGGPLVSTTAVLNDWTPLFTLPTSHCRLWSFCLLLSFFLSIRPFTPSLAPLPIFLLISTLIS